MRFRNESCCATWESIPAAVSDADLEAAYGLAFEARTPAAGSLPRLQFDNYNPLLGGRSAAFLTGQLRDRHRPPPEPGKQGLRPPRLERVAVTAASPSRAAFGELIRQ